jgi:DNA processing protein
MGCNNLIKQNRAALITCADDLLETMGWTLPQEKRKQPTLTATVEVELTADEQHIMGYLRTQGEGQINRMAVELNTPIATLSATLVELEFKARVIALPGGVYRPV